jgi:hypothetical protein
VVRLPAPREGGTDTGEYDEYGEYSGDDSHPHLRIAAELPPEATVRVDAAAMPAAEPAPSRAAVELAAAHALYQSRQEQLAQAEAALAAARQRLRWLDRQHSDARREKADAERRLSDAQLAEQVAADLLADAEHRTRARS